MSVNKESIMIAIWLLGRIQTILNNYTLQPVDIEVEIRYFLQVQ